MHSQAHCHKIVQLQVDKTKLEDPKLCEFMVARFWNWLLPFPVKMLLYCILKIILSPDCY